MCCYFSFFDFKLYMYFKLSICKAKILKFQKNLQGFSVNHKTKSTYKCPWTLCKVNDELIFLVAVNIDRTGETLIPMSQRISIQPVFKTTGKLCNFNLFHASLVIVPFPLLSHDLIWMFLQLYLHPLSILFFICLLETNCHSQYM